MSEADKAAIRRANECIKRATADECTYCGKSLKTDDSTRYYLPCHLLTPLCDECWRDNHKREVTARILGKNPSEVRRVMWRSMVELDDRMFDLNSAVDDADMEGIRQAAIRLIELADWFDEEHKEAA